MRDDRQVTERLPARLNRWLRRYGPAEVAAVATSYGGFLAASAMGAPLVGAAYAAAMIENVGFYGAMGLQAAWTAAPGRRWRAVALLLVEFGPAELLDTFVVRPAAIGLTVWLLGPALGILAGKLLADVAFYALAIATHEHLRRKGVAD